MNIKVILTLQFKTMSRSRLWKNIVDWVWSRRQVGEDAHHRFYAEFISKGVPERRYVEYKDGNHIHASDRMDTEWWSWLHNRRSLPPTEEELATKMKQKHILEQRVQAIEMEEERRRLRMSFHNRNQQNAAERDVLRRRRTLLRLQQAASPRQAGPTPGGDDPPSSSRPDAPPHEDPPHPDARHLSKSQGDSTAEDRNVKEEPTVSLLFNLTSAFQDSSV